MRMLFAAFYIGGHGRACCPRPAGRSLDSTRPRARRRGGTVTTLKITDGSLGGNSPDQFGRGLELESVERLACSPCDEAAQKLAAIGEMTEGIAHDFRNILTVIESGLRLTERNVDDPYKVREFVAGARDGVDRGLRLTSQLLNFAKQRKLDVRPGNLNELLGK